MRCEALAILVEGLPEPPGGWSDALTLDEAGLDSVALLDRIFRVEERFDIAVPMAAGETLGALLDAIEAVAQR